MEQEDALTRTGLTKVNRYAVDEDRWHVSKFALAPATTCTARRAAPARSVSSPLVGQRATDDAELRSGVGDVLIVVP
jgi:hypothetical protein